MSKQKAAAYNAPTYKPKSKSKSSSSKSKEEKKSWVEIKLVDEKNKPVPGEAYKITLPDGKVLATGTLDENGFARVDGIDPGNCKVTFPNMDKSLYKPK